MTNRDAAKLVAVVLTALLAVVGLDAVDGLHGVVLDPLGAAVAGAEAALLTPDRTVVVVTHTDDTGRFALPAVRPGRYLLVVRVPGFAEARRVVAVGTDGRAPEVRVELAVAGVTDEVTVTASRESVEDVRSAGQAVNIIGEAAIASRVKTVTAQAVEGEPGVHLQQTSPTLGGVFVRGLTGNKVNVFVDGVRYSNGAQRGGINTFLDLIEASALDSIEVLRGPSSAQYGSDALGGSVQFLTKAPRLGVPGGARRDATIGLDGGTAHRNVGGRAEASYMAPSLGITGLVAGRAVGAIRTGGGLDSHAAVTRFFGLPSRRLMGERLPDTSFQQTSGFVRANWTPSASTQLLASYLRSV